MGEEGKGQEVSRRTKAKWEVSMFPPRLALAGQLPWPNVMGWVKEGEVSLPLSTKLPSQHGSRAFPP